MYAPRAEDIKKKQRFDSRGRHGIILGLSGTVPQGFLVLDEIKLLTEGRWSSLQTRAVTPVHAADGKFVFPLAEASAKEKSSARGVFSRRAGRSPVAAQAHIGIADIPIHGRTPVGACAATQAHVGITDVAVGSFLPSSPSPSSHRV